MKSFEKASNVVSFLHLTTKKITQRWSISSSLGLAFQLKCLEEKSIPMNFSTTNGEQKVGDLGGFSAGCAFWLWCFLLGQVSQVSVKNSSRVKQSQLKTQHLMVKTQSNILKFAILISYFSLLEKEII